jgi:biotin carboxylase
MNNEFQGKKLLITGGCRLTEDIVKTARTMGIYTIVVDWHDTHTSPAKLIADEYWQESIKDYDRLIELMKAKGIDGVITGFTDSYLVPYAILCEKACLPSYATPELFEKSLDKAMFKQMCKKNGVPVVPEYSQKTFDQSIISKENKVIIKPVDNSGSRGIVICDTPEKYDECLAYASEYSAKRQVIIEKYIELDSISVSYTIQDGEPSLTTVNDDFLYKTPNAGAINCGGLYPSKYVDFYIENIDNKVKGMLKNEGFKNGVLFMQAFTNGEELYFFEMGYRLSGGRHYIFTDNQNGSSSLKQLIHFALTGSMADYKIADRDNPKFKNLCYRFNLIGSPGVVAKIEGFDYMRHKAEVIFASLLKHEGDEVGCPGTTATQLLGAYIVANDQKHFRAVLDDIYSHVRFLNSNGENLVIRIDL